MTKENKEKLVYISLQEASKSCSYTQEYLSLRARQGKLKSAKFGRNWVTTREWLSEYIKKSEEYNSTHNGNGHNKLKRMDEIISHSPVSAASVSLTPEFKKIKIIKVPYNLPIEQEARINYKFAAALVLFLFLTIGIFSQKTLVNDTMKSVSYWSQEISTSISHNRSGVEPDILTADIRGKVGQYFQTLWTGLKIQFANIKNQIIVMLESQDKESTGDDKKEGIVVVTSSEENEAVKKRIQNSFSDEVKVEPKDESSGIITPVFQKDEGEEYFYIMVPIKN